MHHRSTSFRIEDLLRGQANIKHDTQLKMDMDHFSPSPSPNSTDVQQLTMPGLSQRRLQEHLYQRSMPPNLPYLSPFMNMGMNLLPHNANYLFNRAAVDMMALYPTLAANPLYNQLLLRDRFLQLADHNANARKCRRSRTVFTENQLIALEKRFEHQKYLSTPDRMELADALGLTQLQVKTWYQNRRMKWKKQVQQSDSSADSDLDHFSPDSTRANTASDATTKSPLESKPEFREEFIKVSNTSDHVQRRERHERSKNLSS